MDDGRFTNIDPSGDPLRQKTPDDNFIRIAYQNIHGTSLGRDLNTPDEIDAMDELGIDIMGMSETNKPWTTANKSSYDMMMTTRFIQSITIYSSAPTTEINQRYQPGGTLLTVNGPTVGRIANRGTDPMGRFCWLTLRGKRDEGVLIISAYRVCQTKHDIPGAFTAFQQQYTALLEDGHTNPDPRKQLLTDITDLIAVHRPHGFRPIVMMDANGDYRAEVGGDKALATFITDNFLSDPFYEKFNFSPQTYLYGKRRLDYIFMDPALTQAITNIGYLGTHEGAQSDHSLAYADFDQTLLFGGLLNRPPSYKARGLTLSQDDKIKRFMDDLKSQLEQHDIPDRTFTLARAFVKHGTTPENIQAYHKLYTEFLDYTRAAEKTASKKDCGYARSPPLVTAGRRLLLYKMVLHCKQRRAPMTRRVLSMAALLDIELEPITLLTPRQLRREVRLRRDELKDCQHNAESLRQVYIETEAQKRAEASGDNDWKKRVKSMLRSARDSAINRKLTIVTKGRRGILDRITVPTHDWFLSERHKEIYHYDDGIFEAYPHQTGDHYYAHHTIKVLADDALPITVSPMDDGRWMLVERLPPRVNMWQDVTSQSEIEQILLRRNRRHLEQTAREGGVSTRPPLTTLRESHGFNPLSDSVLAGTHQHILTEYTIPPELTEFFTQLKRSGRERTLPSVLGLITPSQFKEMFKRAKERTSSDSRTPNYSIWKSLARSDYMAEFLSVLLSLPFMYGFVNRHWTHMTDFMLEKKPGVRQVHMLRIIGKLAAEFNTCLKFFIGRQARDNFEAADPCDEQHGFRPNRSSVDAAMLKLLTFECARMQRATMGMVQHDMTAHFDRMYPEMTAIYGTKFGVDIRLLRCINKTIFHLERNVETALGISESSYRQEPNAPRIGGMVQGKADVPQLSTQQSDILLKAQKQLTPGLSLPNPDGTKSIAHHSIAFADDTDQHTNVPTASPDAIPQVVANTQHCAQTWNTLTSYVGGLLALHKCNWQLMAWDPNNGIPILVHQPSHTLAMLDQHGIPATVEYVPPTQPNVGLGYRLCPDGNPNPHYTSTLADFSAICYNAVGAHLSEAETRQLIWQRLLPKLVYALHASTFSWSNCRAFNTVLRNTLVPKLRLNRHIADAVLYGPSTYGGMMFPDIACVQDQAQIAYLLRQLRWDATVANDFRVTLDTLQLCAGVALPLLEYTTPTIPYLGRSFIIALRDRMALIRASFWIENVWTPTMQRVGDQTLMDSFLHIPGIGKAKLEKANAVRLYLRVLTIADLVEPTGKYIPTDMLTGDGSWQAGTDLHWPFQPCPPPSFWAAFRWCLRQTFCTKVSPHQPIHYSMQLTTPLGAWHNVPRHTWFPVYRNATTVYRRVDTGPQIMVMKQSRTSGFFHDDFEIHQLPMDCHPISSIQWEHEQAIWTRHPYNSSGLPVAPTALPPGHLTHNNITHQHFEEITLGSDGSLHRDDKVMTCAWLLDCGGTFATACYNITGTSSLSSYRSELEGMYRGLCTVQQMGLSTPLLRQWSDNQAAVDDSNTTLGTPADMLKPDADIIMAIHHVRAQLSTTTIVCRHVYGHQDTRKRPKNETEAAEADKLAVATSINIECDRLATETSRAILSGPINSDLPPTQCHPFPGSKAGLWINGVWITSKFSTHIHRAHHDDPMIEYCCERYDWSTTIFHLVDWPTIQTARSRCTPTEFLQSCKIMHGWLPVMHMTGHITGHTQCPGCPCPDETLDHFLRCPNGSLTTLRRELLTDLEAFCKSLKFHRDFTMAFCATLRNYFDGTRIPPTIQGSLRAAIIDQLVIGHNLMPRGFLARQWAIAAKESGTSYSDSKMATLTRYLWTDFALPLWNARNNILHRQQNHAHEQISEHLATRIQWYVDNKASVLAYRDQFLARFDPQEIAGMSRQVRREWVRHLDAARDRFGKDQIQRAKRQNVITKYFQAVDTPLSPADPP